MLVCIERPNRSQVRHFTEKDVARISRYAVRDGADIVKLIAGVALALGVGVFVCKSAKAVAAMLRLSNGIAKIGGILALSALIQRAIAILSGGLAKLPVIRQIATIILIVLVAIDGLLSAIKDVVENAEQLKTTADFLESVCFYIDNQ